MNSFQGIPISEVWLLIQTVFFTGMLLLLLAAIIAYVVISLSMKNPKARRRIKNLQKRAKSDESARKQLEKLEARNRRRRRRNRSNVISDVIIYSLALAVGILIASWAVIPGWTDYAVKDYVVYTGEITVVRAGKRSHITLDDGTDVYGSGLGLFDIDDTYGTVVYAKRSRIYLGGEK